MILATLIVIGVPVETAAVLSFRIWASATAARSQMVAKKSRVAKEFLKIFNPKRP